MTTDSAATPPNGDSEGDGDGASTRKRRRWPWAVGALVLVVVLLFGAFWLIAPSVIENSQNKVERGDFAEPSAAARALHNDSFIVDMHADTLMWKRDILKRSDRGHIDLPRLQEGNVALQVFSSVSKAPRGVNFDTNSADSDILGALNFAQAFPPRTWSSPLERSLYHAERLQTFVDDSDGELKFVKSKGDLAALATQRAGGSRTVGALYSLEGLQNLEGEIGNLKRLFDAGVRMAGFAHFQDNEAAGSMQGEEKGGLTDLGRAAFAEAEKLGITIDIAHASNAAVSDMLALATKPVVASHGGVKATCEVNRNLSDDQIRGVAKTGGVVGIGYFKGAVCDLTPVAVVNAIDHVVKTAGIGTAALGSDYDGTTTVAWDTSEIVLITQELMNRGYSAHDIKLILGENTKRVLAQNLPD